MPENYYDDAPDAAPAQPSEPAESGDSKTAILPKEMCGDCKPGEEFKVRVVRVHDDSVEVEPCDYEHKEEPAEEPEPDTGGGDMRSMLED